VSVGVTGGITGLQTEFSQLVAKGTKFDSVMFYTHGHAGGINFGDQNGNRVLNATGLRNFYGHGYDTLFEAGTLMYFAGCNVAQDEVGWQFLEAAGRTFLRRGGVTFGWTSVGFAFGGAFFQTLLSAGGLLGAGATLLTQGKVWHEWGDVRYVWIAPGGTPIKRFEHSETQPELIALGVLKDLLF